MPDIEIKRGYEVLPDNNVRFGIRVNNNSDVIISDVEVLLDYSESLFQLEGSKVQKLGTIPPAVPRTAKFILKPQGCIHKENISATIIFKDHQWKKHTLEMRPKEVHCVCPFLKEKSIKRADFLIMSQSGFMEERGVNFEGIPVDKLVDFLAHTCKNRLYKVDEFTVENGKILYLAGDAVGEKAYYLLTAVVKEYEGLTQVLLRVNSDKIHGLNGFLNETLDNLRHLVASTSAREIGIIKKEHVINIIDSVVQRSTISMEEGVPSIKIKDSMMQRVEMKGDEERQGKIEAEGRENDLQREHEEEKSQRRQSEETTRFQREQEDEGAKKEPEAKSSSGNFLAVVLVLGILALGYWMLAPDSTEPLKSTLSQKPAIMTTTIQNPKPAATPIPSPISVITPSPGQKTFTNSIGMEFILIPSGEFDMGIPPSKYSRTSSEPIHHVKITKDFYMGKYEVTQMQWREIMGNNPSVFVGDKIPVQNISWNDAQEFIKKINKKEGMNKYRLPSEAEWEYVARAGTTTRFSFGDDESILGEYAWCDEQEYKIHEVGQKKPNPWGLYDIHGNVLEFVQDTYHDSYIGAPTDGSAWEGGGFNRVSRGGGAGTHPARSCWSGDRDVSGPGDHDSNSGFRLLRIT